MTLTTTTTTPTRSLAQPAPLTWEEACEEKLHDLAMQISPDEVDGSVADADIVLGYLNGEYADGDEALDRSLDDNTGQPFGVVP